jgi:hypothetical protein
LEINSNNYHYFWWVIESMEETKTGGTSEK